MDGNLTATLASFLGTYGLLAVTVVMLCKEIGLPVPVPSDLLMISAGVQAAAGAYSVAELLLAMAAATLIGGSIQFLLIRRAGRPLIYRLGRYLGLTEARLDAAMATLRQRGGRAIFLGLNVPGARAAIIPAAALADFPYAAFAPAMVAGGTVFLAWHIALGFLIGPAALTLLAGLHLPLLPVMVALAAVGLLGWLALRRRKGATAASLHAWTEAACPACLALAALAEGEAGKPQRSIATRP